MHSTVLTVSRGGGGASAGGGDGSGSSRHKLMTTVPPAAAHLPRSSPRNANDEEEYDEVDGEAPLPLLRGVGAGGMKMSASAPAAAGVSSSSTLSSSSLVTRATSDGLDGSATAASISNNNSIDDSTRRRKGAFAVVEGDEYEVEAIFTSGCEDGDGGAGGGDPSLNGVRDAFSSSVCTTSSSNNPQQQQQQQQDNAHSLSSHSRSNKHRRHRSRSSNGATTTAEGRGGGIVPVLSLPKVGERDDDDDERFDEEEAVAHKKPHDRQQQQQSHPLHRHDHPDCRVGGGVNADGSSSGQQQPQQLRMVSTLHAAAVSMVERLTALLTVVAEGRRPSTAAAATATDTVVVGPRGSAAAAGEPSSAAFPHYHHHHHHRVASLLSTSSSRGHHHGAPLRDRTMSIRGEAAAVAGGLPTLSWSNLITTTQETSSEMSSSASSSMVTKDVTVSMHHSATLSVDRSLSVSLPLVPVAASVVEVGLETTVDAALTLTVAGPLAAVATGLTGAANVQRAMLAMSLAVQCHGDDGGGGTGERRGRDAILSASLPRSHSPLGLEGSGCATLSQHCGAVLGNLLLLLITAVVALGVVWFKRRQQQQQKLAFHHQQHQSGSNAEEAVVPYRAVLAAVGLPGRVVPIAVLLLQPTVSSCLTLLWYSSSGGEGAASGAWMGYLVALLGLGTYSALAWLLRRLLASEMNTLQAVYAPPPRPRRGGRSPSLVVASAAWWFTTWVRYEPLTCLAPRKKATAREFCAMWGGALFQKYRRGCGDWFYAVGLWLSAAAGLLGSVIPETQAGCDAVQAFFILLSIAAFGSVAIWRPGVAAAHGGARGGGPGGRVLRCGGGP